MLAGVCDPYMILSLEPFNFRFFDHYVYILFHKKFFDPQKVSTLK